MKEGAIGKHGLAGFVVLNAPRRDIKDLGLLILGKAMAKP
jgi:hypothetical protein